MFSASMCGVKAFLLNLFPIFFSLEQVVTRVEDTLPLPLFFILTELVTKRPIFVFFFKNWATFYNQPYLR